MSMTQDELKTLVGQAALQYVVPGEMVSLKVRPRFLEAFHGGTLAVSVEPRAGGAAAEGASA